MKKILTILLILFGILRCYGQLSEYNEFVLEETGLKDIKASKKLNHIRLWWGCQIVEVWLNKDSSIGGQITCYATEYYEVKNKYDTSKKRKIYSSTYKLPKKDVGKVYELMNESNILNLKNSDSILGWHSLWFDSYSYEIETSIAGKYRFKRYVNPSGQDSTISEARLLDNFFDSLRTNIQMNSYRDKFVESLPRGHEYSFGWYGIDKRRRNR